MIFLWHIHIILVGKDTVFAMYKILFTWHTYLYKSVGHKRHGITILYTKGHHALLSVFLTFLICTEIRNRNGPYSSLHNSKRLCNTGQSLLMQLHLTSLLTSEHGSNLVNVKYYKSALLHYWLKQCSFTYLLIIQLYDIWLLPDNLYSALTEKLLTTCFLFFFFFISFYLFQQAPANKTLDKY